MATFETILVVDDEPLVRLIVKRVLAEHGYNVIEAAGGEEALRICRERGDGIDLLLTDLKMPGIGGMELARQVRAILPSIPVMYMSGFADEAICIAGGLENRHQFLEKPFNKTTLLGKIYAILSQARTSPLPRMTAKSSAAPASSQGASAAWRQSASKRG
ncbi:MAG: response regulator [Acidobacteria bacterium]|nr:response regulator [Acidobacteriota bacterium]MBI3279337.1 response regulator [Acidobacteriota bacterium]